MSEFPVPVTNISSSIMNGFSQWAWSNNPNPDVVSPQICIDSLLRISSLLHKNSGGDDDKSSSFSTVSTIPCLTSILLKLIGLAIILGACLNKSPLLYNIITTKSTAGLSLSSLYAESIMYANSAFYSYLHNNPFTAWGENAVLFVQTIIVVFLVWHYNTNTPDSTARKTTTASIGFEHRLSAITILSSYMITILYVVQPKYYYLLLSMNLPMTIYARGILIYTIYSCKHTGANSLITHSMNLFGSLIRIVTTIGEVGWDVPLLASYGFGVWLNSTLLCQFWVYRFNTKKYLKSLQDKKKED